MAFVYCPECETKISDTASQCPFCGYRSSNKNIPIRANTAPLAKFRWDLAQYGQVFPISPVQQNNLTVLLSKAENLRKIAPAFFEVIKASLPKSILVADIDPAIQELINKGIYRLVFDKSGNILPSIFGEKGIVAQIRLKEIQISPDLMPSIVNLQTQMAIAGIIGELHNIQQKIEGLHQSLHDDRLALADSAWQQLQQAAEIHDSRIRETKLLQLLSGATDAKSTLIRSFASLMNYFDNRDKDTVLKSVLNGNTYEQDVQKSLQVFDCLVAITKTVQIETTAYSLLGEQNATRLCMKQFNRFIYDFKLDHRQKLVELDQYSSSSQKQIIDAFMGIQRDIKALPQHIEETRSLTI